jgi:predicted DsbA family dithiol-disulfide isomerase
MDDMTQQDAVCGPDGCEVPASATTTLRTEASVGTRIDIVSDAICPWCYIGKRQLERALAMLAQDGLHFTVHWNPFQLNPDMPKEGRDRAAYRAWKFGSVERMREADARVAQAAANVGLPFRQDLMLRTPNTIDAHRLIWFAGQLEPAPAKAGGAQDATMEAVFKAYFIQGRDIGDAVVLADCAAQAGLDRDAVAEFLAGDVADQEMCAADQSAREAGVNGVPSFFLDGYGMFSGAMPAETMADALRKGQTILRQRAAA